MKLSHGGATHQAYLILHRSDGLLWYRQVKPVADDEMFKVLRTGKRKNKSWKRMVTQVG